MSMADHGRMAGEIREEDAQGAPEQTVGVPRNLLRDAVFTRLLSNILRGVYRRGQRLRLEQIAQDMSVSRTPVREALVPLEGLRLVSVQQYVGVMITDWSVEHMVERVLMVRALLIDSPSCGESTGDQWVRNGARRFRSEAGAFMSLAEWALRRRGRPVGADWVGMQRPVLDTFYHEKVAGANGIDVSVHRRSRYGNLEAAADAAERDSLDEATACLVAYAELLVGLQDQFRHRPVVTGMV